MNFEEELRGQMADMAASVNDFQEQIIGLEKPLRPHPLSGERASFRVNHLREELSELIQAIDTADLPEQVDALIDLIYIAIGMILEMGVNPIEAFEPVHEANMQKIRGTTKRGHGFDAVKPDGWTPPDLSRALIEMPPALIEAAKILEERGKAYNKGSVQRADHFPLGMISIFQMIWIKVIRMRSDVEGGITVKRDHLIDLINYAVFGINLLDGRPI